MQFDENFVKTPKLRDIWRHLFSLVTLIIRIFRENTTHTLMNIKERKHEKFREIAGSSAPELPDFDEKSQKFRQFGVLTNFLAVLKDATLATLC